MLAGGLAILPALQVHEAHADVLSYGGSTAVNGWVGTQTDLLPTEVSDPAFGQRYDHPVSGQVYAQPVIADDGTGRRVLVAATQNNEVYGLNPDDASVELWHDTAASMFGQPWVIANSSDTNLHNCTDITPNVGATATPVVDSATHTVYMTVKTPDPADATGGTARYFLHALSLVNGAEQTGFPVQITGTADNDPTLTFNPTKQLQRPGLLLLGGVVYMGFGGHCDAPQYDGWVIGVGAVGGAHPHAITARWSDQKASDGFGAGIWMSGSGLASDGAGQILLSSGNGTLPQAHATSNPIPGNTPPANLGESAIRLTVQGDGTLKATDFFSPSNNAALNASDLDLGSSGLAVLDSSFGTPQHPRVGVISGKQPILRSLDLANLGGFDSTGDHVMGAVNVAVDPSTPSGTWGRVGSWPGDGGWMYVVDMSDPVTSGPRASGLVALQRSVDSSGNVQFVKRGTDPTADADWIQTSGSPTITSNGTAPLTAVVWALQAFGHNANQSRLLAFSPVPDASGQLPLLWTGPLIGRGAKFTSAAVDQNHVYIGTRDGHIYGYWLSQVPDLSETPHWFGSQPLNNPTTFTLQLTVRASQAVTVTGASSGDSHFSVGTRSPADGTALAPGSTLQVPVTFTPTTTNEVRSTISLSMADGTTVKVGVGGTGHAGPAHLSTSATSIDFGNHATGSSTTMSFSLSNTGGAPLTIGTHSTSGAAAFTFPDIPPQGQVMQPGATVPVSVTYAPTSPTNGTPDTASVTINSDAGNVTVSVHGTATPPGILTVSPLQLNAGDVPLGSSALLHFTVSNTGGTTISITKSKPPGGDFAAQTQLPEASTLAPGVSKGIDVKFTPTVAGPQTGQWVLNSDGQGGPFTVTFTGNGVGTGPPPPPPPPPPPGGGGGLGYWMTGSDGGVFSFGSAPFRGGTGGTRLNQPIVGMAATPSRNGYWLVASDGGVFSFGDAVFQGSTGAMHLNQPIVGMAATPDGGGYWLVASDGGIFSFGSAVFRGSTGATHLNQPVVGMTAMPDGNGYWLVASDGGIFSFGSAVFHGSHGGSHLNQPIVAMASTLDGGGYWLVASDGGIFSYGTAVFYGSTGAIHLNQPVAGMATTPDGAGYWMVASDGGVFSFGSATYLGGMGGKQLNKPVVAIAA